MPEHNYTHSLQGLMQRMGISSFKALAQTAGVSERQIRRLRCGEIARMRMDVLLKLSLALQVPITELIVTFGEESTAVRQESGLATADLHREYQRLAAQLEEQRQALWQEFQQSSLQILESLILQLPTAAAAAQNNPQLPAARLLPLLQPLSQLLQQWGVEAIAPVGVELPYDPQMHQLMEGTAQKGDRVKVRYTGYRQGDKLLYRAKVSPL
ncbi:MAG: nucleotide exchange factor GrpE [Chroococcidiopsidaceae cyanobacterium CP_BM_ER_R8_30]|nr:nucleotide exchange factor GrpE [Chroococcidiopsidaceae cyanobacterium CP_BM_ER_R8_30]